MPLSVMTLNLLYAGAVNPAGSWAERLPLVQDVLRDRPEIVALQEATAPQLQDLTHALPHFTFVEGPASGETRLPRTLQRATRLLHRLRARRAGHDLATMPFEVTRGEHCAILFRTELFTLLESNAFWVSHTPDAQGSVLPGSWLPRVVNWVRLQKKETGQQVTIFNAHLDFLPWAPLRSARILRRMMDRQWDGSLQVLLGDFNAAPQSSAYTHLGAILDHTPHPPLRDAWQEAKERVGPSGTYHGGTGQIRRMGRLDRILFRPELTVTRLETITHERDGNFPSDHYPVVAEFTETAHG